MSPIGFYRHIPTDLELNGPILSYTTQPVSTAATSGSFVSLTGIATVTFPGLGSTTVNGQVTYQWYEVGIGKLSDTTGITGSETPTLTVSNLATPTDNGRSFFLEVGYDPAGDDGNAVNEPLKSDTSIVTVLPEIEIISQPPNRTTVPNTEVEFEVVASLTDNNFDEGLVYQWQLNGEDVTDGTVTVVVPANRFEQVYSADASVEIPPEAVDVEITVAGASGGRGGNDAGGSGGSGGAGRIGVFSYNAAAGRTLDLKIGRQGNGGGSGNQTVGGGAGSSNAASGGKGGGAGQNGWSGGGGGGGGATGVYDRDLLKFTILAGGGGGGGGASLNRSAPSGGSSGSFSGTTSDFAITNGSNGATKNGDGGGGGAGGGGAKGGSGGGSGSDNSSGGRGGSGGGSKHDSNSTTLISQGGNSGNGYIKVAYSVPAGIVIPGGNDTEITVVTSVSGASTPNLTLSADNVSIQNVNCKISHPDASNSPLLSDSANFAVLSTAEQFIVNIEAISNTTEASLTTVDLFNGDYEFTIAEGDFDNSEFSSYYSFYATEKDLEVEMDLYGGKGSDNNGNNGGEGGYSRIRFTMGQNTEFVMAGLSGIINSPFLYRKATLIAAVGSGGAAGPSGFGGSGGGIGVPGSKGFGKKGGLGAISYQPGELPSAGIFGSFYPLATPISPDTNANGNSGGRTLVCSRGDYWRQQGVSACADVGTETQFRLSDGTIVGNTAKINRGYKAGYSILETSGAGSGNGGKGGTGAVGGDGSQESSGGGGGSGYTDGSVDVISAILGGSNEPAKAILRIVDTNVREPVNTLIPVTFRVGREAAFSNTITIRLQEGQGPETITFGPNAGSVTVEMISGSVYTVVSHSGSLRLGGNMLQLEDSTDNDFNDLTVSPSLGRWTSTTRYFADF